MLETKPYYLTLCELTNIDVIELLDSIEESFYILGYEHHADELQLLLMSEDNLTGPELYSAIINTYRNHIVYTLKMQGINLVNQYNETICNLEKVLSAISIIATNDLSEILETREFVIDEDSTYCILHLLSLVSDTSEDNFATIISSIDERIAVLIKNGLPGITYIKENNVSSENRFKNWHSSKIVSQDILDTIISIGSFGYVYDYSLKLANDYLETITDNIQLAKDLHALAMGSNLTSDVLTDTVKEKVHNYRTGMDLLICYSFIDKGEF